MDTSRYFALSRRLIRPAALVVALAATLFIGGLWPSTAHAQPVLSIEAGCAPAIRPNETAVVTCSASVTNTGDAAAIELAAFLSFSANCALPIDFRTIDKTVNGSTVPVGPPELFFVFPDLAPAETVVASSMVLVSASTGPAGSSITVTSLSDLAVTATADLCFDVSPDAAAPPTNLRVTKTLLTELPLEPPVPPPPNEDGRPIAVEGSFFPAVDSAQYEILVENVGGVEMTGISVLDMQTGFGVRLDSAEPPPATIDDAGGRATWDIGSLLPGDEASIVATYVPLSPDDCGLPGDLAVVTGTPVGGEPETYAAASYDFVLLGACDLGDGDCWHYPPEGEPTIASCRADVCWGESPVSGEYYPAYEGCDASYCWHYPPGDGGEPDLQPCDQEVCWYDAGFSIGPDGEVTPSGELYPIDCNAPFCAFTSPDGAVTIEGFCDFGYCWTAPPGGGAYQPAFDCSGEEPDCWYTFGEQSVLSPCDPPLCVVTTPEGYLDFIAGPYPTECADEPLCWPLPPDGATEFASEPAPCGQEHCWATYDSASPTFEVPCGETLCWVPLGDVVPPELGWPADLLIPLPVDFACEPGDPTGTGTPGGSEVAADPLPMEGTPAVIEAGTSTPIELPRSTRVEQATLVPGFGKEPVDPNDPPPVDNNEPPRPKVTRPTGPQTIADVLGISDDNTADVSGLPGAGEGPSAFDGGRLWVLAAALALLGLTLATAGVAAARRRV
jgi:hypothetical protein